MLPLRYQDRTYSGVRELWSPSPDRMGEGQASGVRSWEASWGHRSRDGGTESSSSGVNWGPSAGQRAVGITKKPAVAGRSSDVAIVSEEAGGQHNRWRSQGPLGRCVVSAAVSAARRKPDYGIKRARPRPPLWPRPSRRQVAKGTADSLLGAVLGKTHRTEFKRGWRKREYGLAAICHDARKG